MIQYKLIIDPKAETDLRKLGKITATMLLDTIEKKLVSAPERYGKSLSGKLKHLRALKISQYRVIYKVKRDYVEVLVIAVGLRKDNLVYEEATKRLRA